MIYKYLIIEQFGDITGTNDTKVAREYRGFSNYRVVDVELGMVFHEENIEAVKEQK